MSEFSLADTLLAAAGGGLIGYGGALLSGCFPLGSATFPLPGAFGKALVLVATAAAALLAAGLLAFIFLATAWAPALIAAGIALLAGPLLFQAVPLALAAHPAGVAGWLLLAAVVIAQYLGRLIA